MLVCFKLDFITGLLASPIAVRGHIKALNWAELDFVKRSVSLIQLRWLTEADLSESNSRQRKYRDREDDVDMCLTGRASTSLPLRLRGFFIS